MFYILQQLAASVTYNQELEQIAMMTSLVGTTSDNVSTDPTSHQRPGKHAESGQNWADSGPVLADAARYGVSS